MNTAKVRVSLNHIIASYISKLSSYTDDIFQLTPPISGWSYSEVYAHIFDASLLSLIAMDNSITGKGKKQATHFMVKLILLLGSLPPAKKYEAPKILADRVRKISKTEAMDFIMEFETALEKYYPKIATADLQLKTKHPRLGYLNAKQWFRFIEIHLKHHLKQLERIEKSFKG
ncbi:DinB family protein [Pedobacter sp. MR22-3]|uniref:DinB family protein n=1 Tax=Pedobacter TaxID=84567 RepID=UPI002248629B|nr:DinB family protein [Pedobacter sp. MR22-3]MCX2582817.1 DinB family protein [Pedobacter sp. MR22-3]